MISNKQKEYLMQWQPGRQFTPKGGLIDKKEITVFINGKSQPVLKLIFGDGDIWYLNKSGGFGGAAVRIAESNKL